MMSSSFSLKYKIIEKIGEGSFSEVLKCQNRATEVFFAAKRLKKCYRSRQEVYECPEIVAMRKISRHPNILYIIETHYEQLLGRVTLIFELLDMSIYDYMKHRKRCLPESRVRNYLYQLLLGLFHLHKNGLFHRDIKPENILIKLSHYDPLEKHKGAIIKLGDLGSIRGIYSKPPYTEYISTRWYRSPECLLTNGYYGPKMDVWAVGCVFYEILTLKPLFPGNDEIDQIHKIHLLLGTPSGRVLLKFKRHQSQNCDFNFPPIQPGGLYHKVQNLSIDGRDTLKQMLVYDPDYRSSVGRLLEHRYFIDFRKHGPTKPRSLSLSKMKSPVPPESRPEEGELLPTHSEVIQNPANNRAVKCKSGSLSLTLEDKKPKAKIDPVKVGLHKFSDYTSHRILNPQLGARLALLKNAQQNLQKVHTKSHSTEKVMCGIDSYFQLMNHVKQPVSKKISDPGGQLKSQSFIGKQFISKSLLTPRCPQTKTKIDESTKVLHISNTNPPIRVNALPQINKPSDSNIKPQVPKITKLKATTSKTIIK